jgi:hypothetical protein
MTALKPEVPRAPRLGAGLVLGIGALLTLLVSTSLIGMLRDVTRFGCTYTEEGEGRGWFCGDGNGYIIPGLTAVMLFAAVGVAAIFVLTLAERRGAVVLSGLAAAPLLVGIWVSFWGAIRAAQAGYDTSRHLEAWLAAMPVPVAALAAAAVLAIVAAVTMVRSPRTARILLGASVAVAFVGVVAQPGLLAPAVASWTLIGAAVLRPPLAP